ncbi:ZBBX isoform 12, partial [Pongo abelii]
MEKVQLEFENQEMEKKLQEFRSTRSKEKEEREMTKFIMCLAAFNDPVANSFTFTDLDLIWTSKWIMIL